MLCLGVAIPVANYYVGGMANTGTLTSTDYETWLSARHAHTARKLANQARTGIPIPGDLLADLLDNLAAIAERDAAED